nr:hypothetical protein CFP56_22404 [Quercus suber]
MRLASLSRSLQRPTAAEGLLAPVACQRCRSCNGTHRTAVRLRRERVGLRSSSHRRVCQERPDEHSCTWNGWLVLQTQGTAWLPVPARCLVGTFIMSSPPRGWIDSPVRLSSSLVSPAPERFDVVFAWPRTLRWPTPVNVSLTRQSPRRASSGSQSACHRRNWG